MNARTFAIAVLLLLSPLVSDLHAAETPGFGGVSRSDAVPAVHMASHGVTLEWQGKSLAIDGRGLSFKGKKSWNQSWVAAPKVELQGEYDSKTLQFAFPFDLNGGAVFLFVVEQDGQHALILDRYDPRVQAAPSGKSKDVPMGSILRRFFDAGSASDLDELTEILRSIQVQVP